MTEPLNELEAWLAGNDLVDSGYPEFNDDWRADFDPDRQLVLSRLGPVRRLFLRPDKFIKRFYHEIYPLPVESWIHRYETKAFDDFCTLNVALDIRFQATLTYVERYLSEFNAVNSHIKQQYHDILDDVIKRQLRQLNDGEWIRQGLDQHEKQIALEVCELLTLHHIQTQVICTIDVAFAEFPDIALGKDRVYVGVLKKMFELTEEKRLESERQARIEKEAMIAQRLQMAELERAMQAQDAQSQILLLQDRQEQMLKQYLIEEQLHADRLAHEQALEQRRFELQMTAESERQAKNRQAELQHLEDDLAHQAIVADKKIRGEIERKLLTENLWQTAGLTREGPSEGKNDEFTDLP